METKIFSELTRQNAKNILTLNKINFSYHSRHGETKVLSDLSFAVRDGEFLSIVGPSGCGKSTLLNLICGLIEPEEGSYLREKDMTIGYMLQRDYLFEWRTIYENVILGLEINHKLTDENIQFVNHLLLQYGLYDFKNKKPSELSGGMRQRAALIRTMALHPRILLLDEPFSSLDYQTRLSVSADIGKIIRDSKKTAILVTHNLSEAISLSDRIIVLSKRPTTVKEEYDIHLTVSDDSPLGYRSAPDFQILFNQIWEALTDE